MTIANVFDIIRLLSLIKLSVVVYLGFITVVIHTVINTVFTLTQPSLPACILKRHLKVQCV